MSDLEFAWQFEYARKSCGDIKRFRRNHTNDSFVDGSS